MQICREHILSGILREIAEILSRNCLKGRQREQKNLSHAVVYARKVEPDDDTFVSDDTPECRLLWETATDNVFEMADADDNNQ